MTDDRLRRVSRRQDSRQEALEVARILSRQGDPDQVAWDSCRDWGVLLGELEDDERSEALLDAIAHFAHLGPEVHIAEVTWAEAAWRIARCIYRRARTEGLQSRRAWQHAYESICNLIRERFPLAKSGFAQYFRKESQQWWDLLEERWVNERWTTPPGVEKSLPEW